MESITSISFVRHGEVNNPKDIFYGRLPRFRLSEEGMRQAQCAAEIFRDKPVAVIFSSPLLRARQTAKIILNPHTNLSLHISHHLNEVHSPYEGRPRSELECRGWDVYPENDPRHDYDQPIDVLTRIQRFVAQARRRYQGKNVIAITHGDTIAFLILWSKGLPIVVKHKQEYFPLPASVHTFFYQTTAVDEVPSYENISPY